MKTNLWIKPNGEIIIVDRNMHNYYAIVNLQNILPKNLKSEAYIYLEKIGWRRLIDWGSTNHPCIIGRLNQFQQESLDKYCIDNNISLKEEIL